ncbi:MAG TPA: 30S ribosomal protein S27ae [Candidatus Nanoarchaeia archaeon]|nr:30S ribosomal protein S27ae [Candidatus Nanoarchaeia archaeon]
MPKKKVKNRKASKKWLKYKIEGGSVIRKKTCPKCGPGVFLGEHAERVHCGKCGYVEIRAKK